MEVSLDIYELANLMLRTIFDYDWKNCYLVQFWWFSVTLMKNIPFFEFSSILRLNKN